MKNEDPGHERNPQLNETQTKTRRIFAHKSHRREGWPKSKLILAREENFFKGGQGPAIFALEKTTATGREKISWVFARMGAARSCEDWVLALPPPENAVISRDVSEDQLDLRQ